MAKAVRGSAAASNQAVEPQPPDDLWEKMDAAMQALADYCPPPPPGAFTMQDFRDRYSLSEAQGTDRLRKLTALGKVKRFGRSGCRVYYVFTDDGKPRT